MIKRIVNLLLNRWIFTWWCYGNWRGRWSRCCITWLTTCFHFVRVSNSSLVRDSLTCHTFTDLRNDNEFNLFTCVCFCRIEVGDCCTDFLTVYSNFEELSRIIFDDWCTLYFKILIQVIVNHKGLVRSNITWKNGLDVVIVVCLRRCIQVIKSFIDFLSNRRRSYCHRWSWWGLAIWSSVHM